MVDVLERNKEWNQKGYRVRFVKKSDDKEFAQVLLKDKTRYLVLEPGEQFQIIAEWKLFADVDSNYEAAKRTDSRYARMKNSVVNDMDEVNGFTADTYPNVAMLMVNGKQASVKYLTDKLAPDHCKMFRSCMFSKVRTEGDKYCSLKFDLDGMLPPAANVGSASESLSLLEQLDPSLESCSIAVYFAYTEKDDPRWYRKEHWKTRATILERQYSEADDINPDTQQRHKVRLVEGGIETVEVINVRPVRCLDSWFNSRIYFKYHTREVFHEVTKGAVPLFRPTNPGSGMPNPFPRVHYVDKTFDELKRKLAEPPPRVISIDDKDDDDDEIIIVSERFVDKKTNTAHADGDASVLPMREVKSEHCGVNIEAETTHSNSSANSFTVEAQIPVPPGTLADSSVRAELEVSDPLNHSSSTFAIVSADDFGSARRQLMDSGNQEVEQLRPKKGFDGYVAPKFQVEAPSVSSDGLDSQRALASSSAEASEDSTPNERVMRMISVPISEANNEDPNNPCLSERGNYTQADIHGPEEPEVCIGMEEPARHTISSATLSVKSDPLVEPSRVQAENGLDADLSAAPVHHSNRGLEQRKVKSEPRSDVGRDGSSSPINVHGLVKVNKEEQIGMKIEPGGIPSVSGETVQPFEDTWPAELPENARAKKERHNNCDALESEHKNPKVEREGQNGNEELSLVREPICSPENVREVKKGGSRASRLFSDANFCEESGAAFFEAARKKPKREPCT